MRLSLLAVPATLLLASNVGAQSSSYPPPDTSASIARVQVTAPFRLSDDETEAVSGLYAMSNGWRLKVGEAATGIVAQIARQRPIRMIAVSADKFVSRDGNVTMDFNRGENRDEMLMTYVPDQRLAVRYVVTATLAQR